MPSVMQPGSSSAVAASTEVVAQRSGARRARPSCAARTRLRARPVRAGAGPKRSVTAAFVRCCIRFIYESFGSELRGRAECPWSMSTWSGVSGLDVSGVDVHEARQCEIN